MSPQEAKQVLLLYRPGASDVRDPQIAEALALLPHDAELERWFEQHCVFQTAVRRKLRQIDVPAELKAKLLAQQKTVRLQVWWRNPAWLAAAAMTVLLLGLAAVMMSPRTPDRFADYQARMIRTVLRQYRMDLETNDMQQVRQFMAARGAPSDYVVPTGLARLQLTGGGLLRWRSKPVAMVCFNRGDNQMLYLFVMKRSDIKDPPPAVPQVFKVRKLQAASWTKDDKTYLLAGPEDTDLRGQL
jgi:hypothetical protein